MGMSVGGSGGPKADINMTPMIDVLLVLIIIFMVITPLTPKGLEALVPQPPPPNQKQSAAELNNAKAGASQATALYDVAMAQNLLLKHRGDLAAAAAELARNQTVSPSA